MSTYARNKMKAASKRFHSWEGTTEYPPGSNRIKLSGIGDLWSYVYPAFQGGAYCAAGDVAAYLYVGVDLRKILTNPYYVPNIVALAKNNGWLRTTGAREGDLVLYGTNGHGVHTGVADPSSGSLYYAHEANTSPGNSGSQNNGGGVYHRGRHRSWIIGWLDMEKVIDYMVKAGLHETGVEGIGSDAPRKSGPALLAVDGELGPKTYKVLSQFSGQRYSVSNGIWTSTDVKHLQRKLLVTVDGKWGRKTSIALQKKIKTPADGIFGRQSVTALQRYLNRGILAGWYAL